MVLFCEMIYPLGPLTPIRWQAKKFVEGVPQVIRKDVGKEEAEKLRAALEAAGGVVEVE